MRSGAFNGASNRGSLLYWVVEHWGRGRGGYWWESMRKGITIKRSLIMTRCVEGGGRCSVRRRKQHAVELLMSELGNLEVERICPGWRSTIESLELSFVVYIPIPIRHMSCNLRRRSGVRGLQGVRAKKIRGRRDWSGWKIRLCWMMALGVRGVNTMIPWAEIYLLFRDPTPVIVTAMWWRIEVVIVSLTSVCNKKTINIEGHLIRQTLTERPISMSWLRRIHRGRRWPAHWIP